MIKVLCSKCQKELLKPGGLAFSPGHPKRTTPQAKTEWLVDKKHLCSSCWEKFLQWLGN